MKKKKLLAFMAFIGLAMMCLFFSPIIRSNASSSRYLDNDTQTIENHSTGYTDTQILNYMQSNNINNRYDMWLFVDSLKKGTTYTNFHYGGTSFSSSFTFQKDHAYVLDGYKNEYDYENNYYNFSAYNTEEAINDAFNVDFLNGRYDEKFDIKWSYNEDTLNGYYDGLVEEVENEIESEIAIRFSSMVTDKMYSTLPQIINGTETNNPRLNSLFVIYCKETFTLDLSRENRYCNDSNNSKMECLLLTEYTLDGTAFDLKAPELDIPANYIVNVDNMQSQEQILSHIIVIDDTDPSPRLIVRSTTYSQTSRVVGTYQFIIYAIDSSENVSSDYTFNVIVADSTNPSNTSFGTIEQPNNTEISSEEILNKFVVSDNYSSLNNITKTLIKNDYSSNWSIPGTHEVICRATDESGNYQDAVGYIQVVDKTAPSNVGSSITQANNVQLSQTDILNTFEATDDVSLANKITKRILSDTYTKSWSIPGIYEVICRATDESGNYKDATTTITVEDKTPPTITGQTIEISYNSKKDDLKSLFTYHDDITSFDSLIFEIITDEYSSTFNVKGNHTVIAKVTDEAGNSNQASALLRVVDRIKPVITAPLEIKVGNSVRLTDEQLREKIVVEDGYDGVITEYTILDNDNYSDNYLNIGTYRRDISASDEEGNIQTLTIRIIVTDTISPQIFYDKYFIILTEGEVLTDEMIKSYASQVLGVSEAAILSLEGTYDFSTIGKYEVSLYMMDGAVQPFTISVGELVEKEPAKWTAKEFFSNNMENWTQFDQWPAWSICAWLSWFGIGIACVIGASILLVIIKKILNKVLFSRK